MKINSALLTRFSNKNGFKRFEMNLSLSEPPAPNSGLVNIVREKPNSFGITRLVIIVTEKPQDYVSRSIYGRTEHVVIPTTFSHSDLIDFLKEQLESFALLQSSSNN